MQHKYGMVRSLHILPSPPQPDDVPIGFHMKLGHNITISTNREVQLGNYSVVSHTLR